MRPAADRENAHDADLQGDDRAGDQATADRGARAADPATGACRTGAAGFIGYPPRYWLCVPSISSPSSLVKGTKGTIEPL